MSDHTKHLKPVLDSEVAGKVLNLLQPLEAEQAGLILNYVQEKLEQQHDDRPMYARGIAGPLGKLICAVKTKVDEVTFDLFLKHCAALRMDASSVLRDYIYLVVHRRTYRKMVMEKINHEAQCAEALVKLIGPIGAPECGAEEHGHG